MIGIKKNIMKKIVIILNVLFMASIINCGRNGINQKNMNNIKSQSLCVLEETGEQITYLTHLARIVQKAGDEQKSYAGGDELFLRYETWTILKNGGTHTIQNCAILHCIPERVAMEDGGSYDTAAFYLLKEICAYYENGKPNGHAELSGEWTHVGLASDNGIYTKIANYFYANKEKITVYQENIEK